MLLYTVISNTNLLFCRDNLIQCPFDRQPTPTGNSGVWGLKKNFALLELLERLQLTPKCALTKVFSSIEALERETQVLIKPFKVNFYY